MIEKTKIMTEIDGYKLTVTREQLICLKMLVGMLGGEDQQSIRRYTDPLYNEIAKFIDPDMEFYSGDYISGKITAREVWISFD